MGNIRQGLPVFGQSLRKIGLDKACLANLRQAQSAIKRHKLDVLYPYFAVRNSSYHRIYSHKDSAFVYAQEAIRTAPAFNLWREEAEGHMLMGILLGRTSPEEMLKHAKAGLRLYEQIEDYTGCSYMYTGIANYFTEKIIARH
ncbi:MAG: hypothetical protein IPN33_05690 [Saprospiraceae bacterium]|nr:hypothetical protein [Saprospiraceae bacterium]